MSSGISTGTSSSTDAAIRARRSDRFLRPFVVAGPELCPIGPCANLSIGSILRTVFGRATSVVACLPGALPTGENQPARGRALPSPGFRCPGERTMDDDLELAAGDRAVREVWATPVGRRWLLKMAGAAGAGAVLSGIVGSPAAAHPPAPATRRRKTGRTHRLQFHFALGSAASPARPPSPGQRRTRHPDPAHPPIPTAAPRPGQPVAEGAAQPADPLRHRPRPPRPRHDHVRTRHPQRATRAHRPTLARPTSSRAHRRPRRLPPGTLLPLRRRLPRAAGRTSA